MPQSRSAGLLAFLLALPSLALVVPPPDSEAAATSAGPEASPSVPPPGQTMEARLRRLSEAIQARSDQLDESQRGAIPGEPWVAAGAWGNGGGRGWANRGWPNRAYRGSYYGRPVWANYRPGWGNFRNSPSFLNW